MPDKSDVLTVSQLADQVKQLLEGQFPVVWVSGEIVNFARPTSGHMYFNLKDSKMSLKCAFFRGRNLRLKFDPQDGMEVLARGNIGTNPNRSEYQLIVDELQPQGIGAQELALKQLLEKLFKKGYFDPARKKPLPRYPRRIALVASTSGAAIRDMLELVGQRWPLAEVIVRNSRVQGAGAAEEISESIRLLNALHKQGSLRIDAMVIGRGGGSKEDLSAFNEEIVADAIYSSTIPIISAVGHEIDVSVADRVADRRAETPSAAIAMLVPDARDMMRNFVEIDQRMRESLIRRVTLARRQLDQYANRPSLFKPFERIRQHEQRLDELGDRLKRAIQLRMQRSQQQLQSLGERLDSLSPLKVLERGYSLTQRADSGAPLRAHDDVQPGDMIVTRLASGRVHSRVEQTFPPDQG